MNPGFPTDSLCDLKAGCLISLCLLFLFYEVKEVIILCVKAVVKREGGGIWGALSKAGPPGLDTSLWQGPSHALQEAEQHLVSH